MLGATFVVHGELELTTGEKVGENKFNWDELLTYFAAVGENLKHN